MSGAKTIFEGLKGFTVLCMYDNLRLYFIYLRTGRVNEYPKCKEADGGGGESRRKRERVYKHIYRIKPCRVGEMCGMGSNYITPPGGGEGV